MKISGANLLSKIPPFFRTMIGKWIMLGLLVGLLVGVYIYFNISNEVKITYFSTSIDNLNDKGYASFANYNKGNNDVEEWFHGQKEYGRGTIIDYRETDTISSFTATLILDYSRKPSIGSQNTTYEVRTINTLDSINLLNKRNYRLYNATLDTLEIDSIVNSVLIEVEYNALISNNRKKFNNNVMYDNHDFGSISYNIYDTIYYNEYFNMPTHRHGGITHFRPNFYWKGCNNISATSLADMSLSIKHINTNLYKNPSVCCLIMDFSAIKAKHGTIKIDFKTPMYFATVSPAPDEQTSSTITYYDNEKLQQIYRNGIYVYAESLLTKKNFENRNFILATIIGFLFSMIIDILYRLLSGKNKEVNSDNKNKK